MTNPDVDLVVVFRTTQTALSKQEAVDEATLAQREYQRLLDTLLNGGLMATGRVGLSQGQLIVLVYAPWSKVTQLVQTEQHSDFVLGLPCSSLPSHPRDFTKEPLLPAERLRLVHGYVTSLTSEGGLGVAPGAPEWPRLESVMALHDSSFNDRWLHAWTHRQFGFGVGYGQLCRIREQFGESVALYFAFLSYYTRSLIFPAAIGTLCFYFGHPFHPIYSLTVVLWALIFVEGWSVREKILSVRWGSYGSFRVEKLRPQFLAESAVASGASFPWWKRELRAVLSLPVFAVFALVLILILTFNFIFEAFFTQIYTGPGHRFVSFSPTILFIALVPRLLTLYQTSAVRMTNWENHAHRSSYDYSLTVKTFALSALVAYSGLALSAFVYVPFHEQIMTTVHRTLFTSTFTSLNKGGLFEENILQARATVNPRRLQDQMYAFTVTNQVINFVLEIVVPFVSRKADSVKANVKSNGLGSKKKRVGFDGEGVGAKEEREFLENVRHQVALPEYNLFGEYAEMATQFGFVAAWSTIWPLAPVMAFLNNWLEMRGDALKIVKHVRRPIPLRTDTVGPWIEVLGFIAWLAALTNTALVRLFEPAAGHGKAAYNATRLDDGFISVNNADTPEATRSFHYKGILGPAMLLALSSSHAYILARLAIRHLLVRLFWKGSKEATIAQEADREVKRAYLRQLEFARGTGSTTTDKPQPREFWERDEGLEEISRGSKEL